MTAFIANLYLIVFLVGGLLAVLDSAARLLFRSTAVALVHGPVSWAVLLLSLVVLGLLVFTVLLPRRLLLPLALFPVALILAFAPAALLLSSRLTLSELLAWDAAVVTAKAPALAALALGAALVQLALGFWALASRMRAADTGRWLLAAGDLGERAFSWGNLLGWAMALVFVAVVLAPCYGVFTLALIVNRVTAGYMRAGPTRVDVEKRTFVRGDRTVALVAMVHIGDRDFYEGLAKSFEADRAVILSEGISDAKKRVAHKTGYGGFADALGLDTQVQHLRVDAGKVKVLSGDVDASDLSTPCIEFIDLVGRLTSRSRVPTLADAQAFVAFVTAPGTLDRIQADLIDGRNAHLLQRIDEVLKTNRVVIVPWGAQHLAGVEAGLRAKGFTLGATESRTVFTYGRVLRGLVGADRSAPASRATSSVRD